MEVVDEEDTVKKEFEEVGEVDDDEDEDDIPLAVTMAKRACEESKFGEQQSPANNAPRKVSRKF